MNYKENKEGGGILSSEGEMYFPDPDVHGRDLKMEDITTILYTTHNNRYIRGSCPSTSRRNSYDTLAEALREAQRSNCGGVTEVRVTTGRNRFEVRGRDRSVEGGHSRHNETSYFINYPDSILHTIHSGQYIRNACPDTMRRNRYDTLNDALVEAKRENCGGVTEVKTTEEKSTFEVRGPDRNNELTPSRHGETSYVINYQDDLVHTIDKAIVIVGAGPVGLYTAIRLHIMGYRTILIEDRKEYTREQIFFIQRSPPPSNFSSFFQLPPDLIREVMENSCAVVPPIFGRFNECFSIDFANREFESFQHIDTITKGIFLGIEINKFESILRDYYIGLGGKITKPVLTEDKGPAKIDIDGSISLSYSGTTPETDTQFTNEIFRIPSNDFDIVIDASGAGSRLINYDKVYVNNNDFRIRGPRKKRPTDENMLSYGLLVFIDLKDRDKFTRFDNEAIYDNLPDLDDPRFIEAMIPNDTQLHHIPQHRFRAFISKDIIYLAVMLSRNEYDYLNISSRGKISVTEPKQKYSNHFDNRYLSCVMNSLLYYYGIISRENIDIFTRIQFSVISVSLSRIPGDMLENNIHGKNVYPIGDSALGVNFFSGSGVNYGFEMSNILINYLTHRSVTRYQRDMNVLLNSAIQTSLSFLIDFDGITIIDYFVTSLGISSVENPGNPAIDRSPHVDIGNLPYQNRPIRNERDGSYNGFNYIVDVIRDERRSQQLRDLLANNLNNIDINNVLRLDTLEGADKDNDKKLLFKLINKLYFYVLNTFSRDRKGSHREQGTVFDMRNVHVRYVYRLFNNKVSDTRRRNISNIENGTIVFNNNRLPFKDLNNSYLFMILLTTYVSYVRSSH